MAAKYDWESLAADIETILKNNLNTKITALDAEKADTITLDQVNSSAYFFQTMNDSIANFNPFIFYGIDNIESEGIPSASSDEIEIAVWLVLDDDANDLLIANRMLRYTRALKEVFEDNWNETRNRSKIVVKAFAPVQFQDAINSSNSGRIAQISIMVSMSP